jgi:hypothetical protein
MHTHKQTHRLQVWGDNPFESQYAIDDLVSSAEESGWQVYSDFAQGFIPVAKLENDSMIVEIEGFGYYRQWKHLARDLDTILGDGKVDQVFIYPDTGKIDFAIEDSSATMTGNQFQQRLERIAGFAIGGVPTAYLVPGFAVKAADGGIRSPNIWAEITALQLMAATKLPHLVFYFGSRENPDDKRAGQGGRALSAYRWARLLDHIGLPNNLVELVSSQIKVMLKQIAQRKQILFDVVPEWDDSLLEHYSMMYAKLCLGHDVDVDGLPFNWSKVPKSQYPAIGEKEVVNIQLPLAQAMGRDILDCKAYFPIAGKSVGRPSSFKAMKDNLTKQIQASRAAREYLDRSYSVDEANQLLREGGTPAGNVSPTVMEKGIIVYERFRDFRKSLEASIGWARFSPGLQRFDHRPALVFVAGNVVQQFLRDPFAGMLASYAISFGAWDPRQETVVILYCPWQSAMVAHTMKKNGIEPRKSKTTAAWLRFTDLTIFNDAVIEGGFR